MDKTEKTGTNVKKMSAKGQEITAKLEKLTGIKLTEDEENKESSSVADASKTGRADNKDNAKGDKSVTDNPVSDNKIDAKKNEDKAQDKAKPTDNGQDSKGENNTSKLQNIEDIDLGQDNAVKPLLFKCPNDMYLTIKKDNGEVIIDESCCTVLSVMIKNTGEIATNFSGSHNPDMVKILDKSMKRYLRALRKKLKKDYKIAREELQIKDEEIPEDKKFIPN